MTMHRLPLATAMLLALTGSVAAQDTAPPAPAAPAATPTAPAAPAQPGNPTLEPTGFDYVPDGRRDPFVSLMRRGADTQRADAATRPPGLGGLETAEVTLKGTMQTRDGFVAMLQGADGKTYIVRAGDRLLDGTVRTISQTAVVILQQVHDPLSLDKQREVRKTIRQADEAS
jgi:Tfp pilus assembly protein PilP